MPLPAPTHFDIQTLVDLIVTEVEPVRVVLFGSAAQQRLGWKASPPHRLTSGAPRFTRRNSLGGADRVSEQPAARDCFRRGRRSRAPQVVEAAGGAGGGFLAEELVECVLRLALALGGAEA
jgi:hypothetical protein